MGGGGGEGGHDLGFNPISSQADYVYIASGS